MTNIVNFTPRAALKDVGAVRRDASARVVIFPGVRYERVSASTQERQPRLANKLAREPSTPGTS